MTAVASPVQLQQPSRTGWNSVNGGQNGLGNISQEEMSRMFVPGPRKTAQRSNSSSSLSSTSSSTSTISASSINTNGAITSENWAARKKPNRGIWPPGKSEPTSGLSTARPQSVSSASSGPSAASGLSALHGPPIQSQQMANGTVQQNGTARGVPPSEGSAFLYLLPMNGTFERKTIHVPYYPDVLRIGRQTNAKTAPTPTNGFFDSKVLSRQHAEVYAERNGRIFIRDVKSSNGTFVNGKRLSPENKESEPHELREQDVLELGIDIVSEDQKTVVHHKVAARVEHAGIYPQGGDIGFGDLDPSGRSTFMSAQQTKRVGAHPGLPNLKTGGQMNGPASGMRDPSGMQQQPWQRMWLQPISTENIVRRLNRELNLARQQAQDIARAKQSFDSILEGKADSNELDEKKAAKQKPLGSPNKKVDMNHFPEPPAPPPSQPLPEKPDTSKSLNDSFIQPLLQRSETAKPNSLDANQPEHSQALFILTHELKAAKDQIPNLQDRVKALEQQLQNERTARVNAEERAYQLEHGPRKDSAEPTAGALDASKPSDRDMADSDATIRGDTDYANGMGDVQSQLHRLHANMADMKQQIEAYRRRAEIAESERDQARLSLAEMIESKRAALSGVDSHDDGSDTGMAKDGKTRWNGTSAEGEDVWRNGKATGIDGANGHTIRPFGHGRNMPVSILLQKAGVGFGSSNGGSGDIDGANGGGMITRQQAMSLQRVLKREMLGPEDGETEVMDAAEARKRWEQRLAYHGIPHAAALTTVIVGLVVMRWLNAGEKVGRLVRLDRPAELMPDLMAVTMLHWTTVVAVRSTVIPVVIATVGAVTWTAQEIWRAHLDMLRRRTEEGDEGRRS